ncbi:MAG: hypothetical protein EBX41_01225 [Chitinophagia bacterium]|nr:hypothetical protein [Chitinophagia bacterium]
MLIINEGNERKGNKRLLIDEYTSPLHRIMWVYNAEEPDKRSFENNVCAFHVGNGYVLTVAHNLRTQAGIIKSIDNDTFHKELHFKLDGAQKNFWFDNYFVDDYSKKMYIKQLNPEHLESLAQLMRIKRIDTRWETLAAKKICNPYLVIQFKQPSFYGTTEFESQFAPYQTLYERESGRYSYFLPLQIETVFYAADIALYKIINTPPAVINKIPSIELDFEFLEETPTGFACLQSAPNSPLGRLLSQATIDGMLDHFSMFYDDFGGNFPLTGYRYHISGYFRFGTSGAPYIYYNTASHTFKANAIQSEASGIQFSIKNDRDGNFQFINAIATPLQNIKDELLKVIKA